MTFKVHNGTHVYIQPTDSCLRGEGSTALSVAVRSRAPLPVVQQLLEANFLQVGVTSSGRGTILHEAIKHRASDGVLMYLVRAVISFESRTASSLLGHTDDIGRTALHKLVDRIVRSLDNGERNQANWDILRMLVDANPAAVSSLDSDGNTPLVQLLVVPPFKSHELDLEEYLFQMVNLMINRCPNAITVARRLPQPWHYHFHFEDKDSIVHGEGIPSPLSCALLYGRSSKTIDLLLETDRRLGANGCRTMVTHHKEVPLHVAVTMRRPIEILQRLVRADNRMVETQDKRGLTPLDWMWIRHVIDSMMQYQRSVMVSRRRYIHNLFPDWHIGISEGILARKKDDSISKSNNLESDLLQRMQVLLPALASQMLADETLERMVDDEEDPSLVHATSLVPCPLAIVQMACLASPKSLATRDARLGRLPLHYAVTRESYNVTVPLGVSCSPFDLQEATPTSLVLSAFPQAARIVDSQGQLPLHLAIEGRSCETEALLRAYPESLHRRDGVRKLYPFQLAAACDDLDLAFELLRLDPSLIQTAI